MYLCISMACCISESMKQSKTHLLEVFSMEVLEFPNFGFSPFLA